MTTSGPGPSRRALLSLAGAATAALALPFPRPAIARATPLRIGLLLPYSGTYAQLGEAITRGIELYVKQSGGALAGRSVSFVRLDDESDPPKAPELTNRLVQGEAVDVLCGSVHSGVAMAMSKIARETGVPTIIPNAGANVLTRALCARNVFRTSFANSQVGLATGRTMAEAGIARAVGVSWKYAAGEESLAGFRDGFTQGGGRVLKDVLVPFPTVAFQAVLAEIASLRPDAVYVFLSGGGGVKFLHDYAAAGLRTAVPLWGNGFITEGLDEATARTAEGLPTVLHYADDLDTPENKAFRVAFEAAFGTPADVYAVQGFDAMQLLDVGLRAVGGDVARRDALCEAMRGARFASPRGPFRLSASHNPVQNFYLRRLEQGRNVVVRTVLTDFADPTTGCRLAA